MRRSTTVVLTLATLAGGGTTVWTIGSLEPVAVEVVDIRARLIADLMEAPDRIDSWTAVARSLLSLTDERGAGGPERAVENWLGTVDPSWAEDAGAEAMVWYAVSHQLAIRAASESGTNGMYFDDPAASSARQRAIDALLRHSQARPGSMKHWHWNSLAWAWARSRRYDRAVGALHRTEEAVLELPADTPADVMNAALLRVLGCWGPQAINDESSAAAFLVRVSEDIDDRAGASPFASLSATWLAEEMAKYPRDIRAEDVVEIALRRLRSAPAGDDLRLEWLRLSALVAQMGLDEMQSAALDGFETQLERHGESADNARLTWNELGWRRRLSGDDAGAHKAWNRWLEGQRSLAHRSPNADNLYNLACGLALVGRMDDALDALALAADAGWMNYTLTAQDRDLRGLAEHPRFSDILDRIRGEFQAANRIPGDAR